MIFNYIIPQLTVVIILYLTISTRDKEAKKLLKELEKMGRVCDSCSQFKETCKEVHFHGGNDSLICKECRDVLRGRFSEK
jgi:hypothetical protein